MRVLTTWAIIGMTFMLHACGCVSGNDKIEKAIKLGQNDAETFINLYHTKTTSQLTLESFLLEVRYKENVLRRGGYNSEADIYIETFRNSVNDLDSILGKSIFY